MISRTVTAVLDAPQADVFDFLSRVENLPAWATDFARELRYEAGPMNAEPERSKLLSAGAPPATPR